MAQGQYLDARNGGEVFHDLLKSLKDPQGMPSPSTHPLWHHPPASIFTTSCLPMSNG